MEEEQDKLPTIIYYEVVNNGYGPDMQKVAFVTRWHWIHNETFPSAPAPEFLAVKPDWLEMTSGSMFQSRRDIEGIRDGLSAISSVIFSEQVGLLVTAGEPTVQVGADGEDETPPVVIEPDPEPPIIINEPDPIEW